MNNLPADFQFSQSSLQDYLDCARRFELRYILRQKWPGLQSEPVLEREAYMKLGQQFHILAHQYFLGIPRDYLCGSITEPLLQTWYKNLQDAFPLDQLPLRKYSEISLTTQVGKNRLVAKMDMVVFGEQGLVQVFDWKTSQKPPRRKYLQAHIQTHLYPLVTLQAGGNLHTGCTISPPDIQMIYWFPNFPEKEEIFRYDNHKYQQDIDLIDNLVQEIRSIDAGDFALTTQEQRCLFCNYRSLCKRGEIAGDWRTVEDLEDLDAAISQIDFDFMNEQIGEAQI